jgi:signal transduction histidine kinase
MAAVPNTGPAGDLASVVTAALPGPVITTWCARLGHNLRTADALLAVLVAAAALAVVMRPGEPADVSAAVLAVTGALCLVWRRHAPMAVLFVSASCFCLYEALGYAHRPLPIAVLIALYTVAASTGALIAAIAAAALVVGAVGSDATRTGWPPADLDDVFLANLLSVGAASALGYAVQLSRARHQLLHEQAKVLRSEHAAHEQRLLHQEHANIARELHDVIAHQISLITALACGAKRISSSKPELAWQTLDSIEIAGREALAEMRRLLLVLRADSDTLVLRPSLHELPTLAAHTETAGLPVRLTVRGDPRPLPAGVEVCAYRIVQEALTNTLKHAGPCRTIIEVTYLPTSLELRICDDGRGMPADPGIGHGLIGMHERAALVHGRLAVSGCSSGGVQVSAWLPADGDSP